jgi:hypothetical protein
MYSIGKCVTGGGGYCVGRIYFKQSLNTIIMDSNKVMCSFSQYAVKLDISPGIPGKGFIFGREGINKIDSYRPKKREGNIESPVQYFGICRNVDHYQTKNPNENRDLHWACAMSR